MSGHFCTANPCPLCRAGFKQVWMTISGESSTGTGAPGAFVWSEVKQAHAPGCPMRSGVKTCDCPVGSSYDGSGYFVPMSPDAVANLQRERDELARMLEFEHQCSADDHGRVIDDEHRSGCEVCQLVARTKSVTPS